MAMYVYAVFVIFILSLVAMVQPKSIDQIIMEAAPKASMLDTFQMSPDGDIMLTMELDIKMNMTQYQEYKALNQVSRQKRKAVRSVDYRWDNCYVYYEVTRDFDTKQRQIIRQAMDEWEKYTCLEFKKAKRTTKDKIVFSAGSGGCYSRLGKTGGAQEIGLSRGCVHKGVVIHEIGHAIGWIHEQARPDRDNYIKVNFHRIPESWHPQYEKSPASFINDYQVEYDYRSIMHYSGNSIAPRSIETLDPKFQNVIGQREGLSFRDIHIANVMYNCPSMKCKTFTTNCRQLHGADSFVFKLNERCQCVCPGEDGRSPIMPCRSRRTTPTYSSTTTPARSTTMPARSTTAEPPMECRDLRPGCDKLKLKGECKMDMERMMMYCKKTCNFCGKGKMCMDFDSSCPLLALGKFCEKPGFRNLMHMQCKKSCGLCTPVPPCEMQLQMGLGLDVQVNSGHMHSYIGTIVLGLLVLAWTLH